MDLRCKANACPLPVELITQWDDRKPKNGVCRFHALSPGPNWKAVTERIIEHERVIGAFILLERIQHPCFLPVPGETVPEYIDRGKQNLRRIILCEAELEDIDGTFEQMQAIIKAGISGHKHKR